MASNGATGSSKEKDGRWARRATTYCNATSSRENPPTAPLLTACWLCSNRVPLPPLLATQ
ncbi:hypothetical protein P7K49_009868 [Saguinus oedipus]|uniref:Uncharacterized protein n=1 Tax=Saguinus oedipus TaxID=9490 RepID=A0ABQ9VLZ2_SAGOE|nr:hypothetical protein P7K49_009861 [Saguinus oedipus]KAK2110122.1 hypothetical protein P7K49_009868 [Saguinus oedipus]